LVPPSSLLLFVPVLFISRGYGDSHLAGGLRRPHSAVDRGGGALVGTPAAREAPPHGFGRRVPGPPRPPAGGPGPERKNRTLLAGGHHAGSSHPPHPPFGHLLPGGRRESPPRRGQRVAEPTRGRPRPTGERAGVRGRRGGVHRELSKIGPTG